MLDNNYILKVVNRSHSRENDSLKSVMGENLEAFSKKK